MGAWYTIGLFAGLGAAIGVLAIGLLASIRSGVVLALVLAIVVSAALGYTLHDWKHALSGGIGAALGAFGASRVVTGALARGGTRGGIALLVAGVAVVLAALAFVPALGYLEAVALPVLGARLRARGSGRYQGLRILAKD